MGNVTSDIEIVPMTVSHVPEASRIEKAVFPDPWSPTAFLEILSLSDKNWIVRRSGRLVAYLLTQWVADEVHILNLAVAPRVQRQGIAARLLAFLVERAAHENMQDMFLEVRASNVAARSLYERFGFRELAVRKRYYRDGEDAVVMHCPVKVAPTETGDAAEGETGHTREE